MVKSEKSCISSTIEGLSNECLEAEKKGGKYSCTKCNSNYALVEDINAQIKNCNEREGNLIYCLEGKLENGNYICTKCVSNSELKDNICACNSNSFNKDNNWC